MYINEFFAAVVALVIACSLLDRLSAWMNNVFRVDGQ